MDKYKFIFESYDTDKDGRIDKNDFIKFLYELGKQERLRDHFDTCFKFLDSEGKGFIDLAAFEKGISALYEADFMPPGMSGKPAIAPESSPHYHIYQALQQQDMDDFKDSDEEMEDDEEEDSEEEEESSAASSVAASPSQFMKTANTSSKAMSANRSATGSTKNLSGLGSNKDLAGSANDLAARSKSPSTHRATPTESPFRSRASPRMSPAASPRHMGKVSANDSPSSVSSGGKKKHHEVRAPGNVRIGRFSGTNTGSSAVKSVGGKAAEQTDAERVIEKFKEDEKNISLSRSGKPEKHNVVAPVAGLRRSASKRKAETARPTSGVGVLKPSVPVEAKGSESPDWIRKLKEKKEAEKTAQEEADAKVPAWLRQLQKEKEVQAAEKRGERAL